MTQKLGNLGTRKLGNLEMPPAQKKCHYEIYLKKYFSSSKYHFFVHFGIGANIRIALDIQCLLCADFSTNRPTGLI